MSQSSSKTFMTPKSYKTTQRTNITHSISSNVQTKPTLLSRARESWLIIIIGIMAFAGVVGTIIMAIVSFVVLRSTTISSTIMTTTAKSTSTTTSITRCFTIPSPRPSNVWLNVSSMTVPRVYHSSTFISQDNSVLIVGGASTSVLLSSVEKYISSTGCFQTMRNMPRVRYFHTADQLPSLSGYVVIAGGLGSPGALEYADLYNPMTGDILTTFLTSPRYRHVSAIIGLSQLVLIGGLTTGGVIVNSSDMINTAGNSTFISGSNTMSEPRVYHAATVLGNNSDVVLITGGYETGAYLGTALLYHGSSNSFISLGSGVSMTPARGFHSATYLPPPIHKVLIVGGVNSGYTYGTMFLFDVASLTFSPLSTTLIYPRDLHTATLLPNGKVLIIGGFNVGALRTCELIDPSNNYTVTLAASLNTNRYYHSSTLINDGANGTILACGGLDASGAVISSCELYFV